MSEINVSVTNRFTKSLWIGKQGERDVTRVNFNVNGWIDEFGIGTVILFNRRNQDEFGYPIELTIENNIAIWNVSQFDLQYSGLGECELTYCVGNKIKKSITYSTYIAEALKQGSYPPSNYTGWFDRIVSVANKLNEADSICSNCPFCLSNENIYNEVESEIQNKSFIDSDIAKRKIEVLLAFNKITVEQYETLKTLIFEQYIS